MHLHTLLIYNITKYVSLTEEEKKLIVELFEIKNLKRKEKILEIGNTNAPLAFINSGCLRSYSVDRHGYEHILQFAPSDWWITNMTSCINKSQSELCIEAIEPSQILEISRENQLYLIEKVPSLSYYFWKLGE